MDNTGILISGHLFPRPCYNLVFRDISPLIGNDIGDDLLTVAAVGDTQHRGQGDIRIGVPIEPGFRSLYRWLKVATGQVSERPYMR